MKAIEKCAKYKWYDPIVDAPLPQSSYERRSLNKHVTGGAALGAAISGAALTGLEVALMHKDKSKPIHLKMRNDGPDMARVLGGTGLGAAIGGSIGGYLGGRKVLKRRVSQGLPMYSPREEARKLKDYKSMPVAGTIKNIRVAP